MPNSDFDFEEERQRFEAVFAGDGLYYDQVNKKNHPYSEDFYIYHETEQAWRGWKAAKGMYKGRRESFFRATAAAKKVLKKGDRITVTKCPGTKRWIIFDHWEGNEIISASGESEYAATSISRLNGEAVDFNV